jgi:hypothetical protein
MEKNFTELHVGGVYLRRDGRVDWIDIKDDGNRDYPFKPKGGYTYSPNGIFIKSQEHDYDLVQHLCDIEDLKRLPEIMAENERLKAEMQKNAADGQSYMEECHNEIIKLKAEIEQLKAEKP